MRLACLALLLTLACDVAPPTGTVSIDSASLSVSGDEELNLALEIANGTEETVFVYERIRAVLRDDETQVTSLLMRDRPWVNSGSSADCHLTLPSTREIAPRAYETIELQIPRQYVQLDFNADAEVELAPIPVADAREVRVELAWADEPFVGQGCSQALAEELLAIQDGVASAAIRR